MNCPYCTKEDTSVLESRNLPGNQGMRRRRECNKCKKRFTTHEKVVNIDLRVIKKSGRVEAYEREKLMKGVQKAFFKRGVGGDVVNNLVDDVELKILNRKTVEIRSCDIGKMVLSRLKKIDDLAYVRFASVYKDFENIDQFLDFVKKSSG